MNIFKVDRPQTTVVAIYFSVEKENKETLYLCTINYKVETCY